MPDKRLPDSSKDEIRVNRDTLKVRYDHEVDIQLADAEMRLYQTYATVKRRHDDLLDGVVSHKK